MIILFIITSVLYLLMVGFVLYLYYTYRKDYEELEKRLLEIEKRYNQEIKDIKFDITSLEDLTSYTDEKVERRFFDMKNLPQYNEVMTFIMGERKNRPSKEGDNMTCKKGRGGRKK